MHELARQMETKGDLTCLNEINVKFPGEKKKGDFGFGIYRYREEIDSIFFFSPIFRYVNFKLGQPAGAAAASRIISLGEYYVLSW